MIAITAVRTLDNGTVLAQYTINGSRSASFIPRLFTAIGEVYTWLMASITEGAAAAAEVVAKALEADAPIEPTLEETLDAINEATSSWLKCALWARVAGKESVYVTLTAKSNGGKSWNQGIGGKWRIELASGRVSQAQQWAGAATRDKYERDVQEILDQITDYLKR